MIRMIDIGPHSTDVLADTFGFYRPSKKTDAAGIEFYMYAGYYLWLLSGKTDTRCLEAKSIDELPRSTRRKWVYVGDLDEQMIAVLKRNAGSIIEDVRTGIPTYFYMKLHRKMWSRESRWVGIVLHVCH